MIGGNQKPRRRRKEKVIKKRKYKEYAIYKGEEIIDIGTVKELASKHNVSINTIYFLSSPANHRRNKGNKKIAIVVNDEEEKE